MEPEDEKTAQARRFAAVDFLRPHGFRPIGQMKFIKNGLTYDLSAADLQQIERIEREGLFLVLAPFTLDEVAVQQERVEAAKLSDAVWILCELYQKALTAIATGACEDPAAFARAVVKHCRL